jgi:hypothetical protein
VIIRPAPLGAKTLFELHAVRLAEGTYFSSSRLAQLQYGPDYSELRAEVPVYQLLLLRFAQGQVLHREKATEASEPGFELEQRIQSPGVLEKPNPGGEVFRPGHDFRVEGFEK